MEKLLICLALFAGLAASEKVPGFDVTLASWAKEDIKSYVVVNGTGTEMYQADNPTATMKSDVLTSTFYISMNNGEQLQYSKPRIKSDHPQLLAKLTGAASRKPTNTATKKPKPFTVMTNCVGSATFKATVTVTIPVGDKEVRFAFMKKCQAAKVAGFDVSINSFLGEGSEGANYAVRNGEATVPYDEYEPSAVILHDKPEQFFYIVMNANGTQQMKKYGKPYVEVQDVFLKLILTGVGAEAGIATKKPRPLVARFDCSGSGNAMVTIHIPLDDGTKVSFSMTKVCLAGEIPGFDITLSLWEPGVRSTYAVKNGAPTPAYQLPAGVGETRQLPTAVVREAQFKTTFYMQMSNDGAVEFEAPLITTEGSFCKASLGGDAVSGGWADDISSTLVINFNCIDSGSALVTVHIPVFHEEKLINVSYAFLKECRWTNTPGFDVTLGAYVKSARGTYAVRNGAATQPYSLWEPTAMVRAKQFTSIFYLQMSNEEVQDFDWPQVESSETFCKVTIGGTAAKGGTAMPPTKGSRPKALIVKYNCVKSGTAVVTVTIPLGPWNEATFAFNKVCEVGQIPGFDVTLGAYVPGDRLTYAVKNGEATEAYDPVDHIAIVRYGTPSYTFYIQLPEEDADAFLPPTVFSSNELVKVNLSGDAIKGGKDKDHAYPLVLNFDCEERAKSDILVHIKVATPGSSGEVSFGFKKDCKPGLLKKPLQLHSGRAPARLTKKKSTLGQWFLYIAVFFGVVGIYSFYQQAQNHGKLAKL